MYLHISLFLICQAALMISLIWKYYSDPVTVVPSKWIAPVERLVAFPTGVAGNQHVIYCPLEKFLSRLRIAGTQSVFCI